MIRDNFKGTLCALGAVLIWSGFILASRQGGISPLNAFDIIAIRYMTCAIVLLPVWMLWQRFSLLNIRLIVCALIGGLAYALFAFTGFEYAPASHAAVLLPGLLPLIISLLNCAITGVALSPRQYLGISSITLGIGLLFINELTLTGSFSIGHLCLLASAICWGLFSVLIKLWQIKPWEATIGLALITCALYLPIYIVFLPKNITVQLLEDIALQAFYQGVMATIIQMLLYVRAIQLIGAAKMGTLMALVPILAGFSAIPLFQEALTQALCFAFALVSLGIWMIHFQPQPLGKLTQSIKDKVRNRVLSLNKTNPPNVQEE